MTQQLNPADLTRGQIEQSQGFKRYPIKGE
jgi:hypothetical protein